MTLNNPVSAIPLIGPRNKRLLENLEIKTVRDLLYHFPFRYNDYSQRRKINEVLAGETVTVVGQLKEIKNVYTRGGKNFVQATLADETGQLRLVWFNQPFIAKSLRTGETLGVSGRLGSFGNKLAIISPEYEIFTGEATHTGRLVPVYPETAGVSSKWLRSRINWLLSNLQVGDLAESLPKNVVAEELFPQLFDALKQIHFPSSLEQAAAARRRFSFEELFNLTLRSLLKKKAWSQNKISHNLRLGGDLKTQIEEFKKLLPFKLTAAQQRVSAEILADLIKDQPMNRLLEGDVGSGKTVVAAISAYAAILNNTKVLYMAPTEILARQHFETFKNLFQDSGVEINLVTGRQRTEVRKQKGESVFCSLSSEIRPQIYIGTHALLYQEDFTNIGLVIIDEQHRFGVEQRAHLLEKCGLGGVPHLLTMTATPIPRSLQLILLGDLDLSVIDEMPLGRKKVKTWVVPKNKRDDAYNWVKNQKTPAFVVCPFIEESETETLAAVRAATKEFKTLQKLFSPLRVGLLHGRLKATEKTTTVDNFRQGRLDILVTTPVVEVGVDIPQASIMIVEGAERFGLASLHQLRGRVGRAGQQAYCLLFTSDDKGETTRLKFLETVYNGAELAQIDLKFRGGGDVFGTLQHGLPRFKIADPGNTELVGKAKKWAEEVITYQSKYPELATKVKEITSELVAPN